jgi:hypothetical protein
MQRVLIRTNLELKTETKSPLGHLQLDITLRTAYNLKFVLDQIFNSKLVRIYDKYSNALSANTD